MRWPLVESDSGAVEADTPLFRDYLPRRAAGRFEDVSA
jgi:hypothetical protein